MGEFKETTKPLIWTCLGLFFFGLIFFLINIQFPRGLNFDEFHYVPSAKQFLEMRENQNYEHPPLGKELMAIGIGLWGDRPIGWRFMSTLFGALTWVGMYLWGLALFRDRRTALWVALLTGVNQLLYVQARIGMLDTFMFAFMAWGLAAFTQSWSASLDRRSLLRLLYFSGAMLGLATACKWFGLIPWAACIALVVGVRVLQFWGTRFTAAPKAPMRRTEKGTEIEEWYHPDLWKGIRPKDWAVALVAIPLFTYFLTFIPFLFIDSPKYGFFQIFGMQAQMWDGQSRVVSPHPYMSTWKDWATLKRPIWYAFDKEGANGEFVRGVLLLGNPLIMWGGFLALFSCAHDWIWERRREAFLILCFYGMLYFSWMLIPRKVSFYYYYYPAGMVLSFVLADAFRSLERRASRQKPLAWAKWAFLGASTAVFIYFFPILSAFRIHSDNFRKWMWFNSWI